MATTSHHLAHRSSHGFPRGGECRAMGRVAGSITRTSTIYVPHKAVDVNFTGNSMVDLNQYVCCHHFSKKKCRLRQVLLEFTKHRPLVHKAFVHKARRMRHTTLLASTDDGVTVNGTPQASSSNDVEEMRVKLDESLQGEDLSSRLVQSIHDSARAIELAIQEQSSLTKDSWFPKAWLGLDKNAWVKTLSYQAAVYSLLQAAIEISSRGDGRERHVNVLVERSLLRLCSPLESIIRDELSSKLPVAYEWFWSHQHPMVVATFVNLFERDHHFNAAITSYWNRESSGSDTMNDLSIIMLALSCVAAVTKLGSAKVSCSQFFSMVPDITGRLMDMLLDFLPIKKAYYSVKDIGLHREFLFHFGPRAAVGKFKNDQAVEEIAFWVDLLQKQLQRAIDRERIWSRLTTCESIEVLEKDLAIFGFFIALGRSTQSFLLSNGVTIMDDPIESVIRYLIGGSVLYYPQLSSISSYQLYVEVVCEELEWLPFYQRSLSSLTLDDKGKRDGSPREEAITRSLNVCSYWMTSFIKYSKWLENPSNIKAARFLSRGHALLNKCIKEHGVVKDKKEKEVVEHQGSCGSERNSSVEPELDSFDKALESVEEALNRLEDLLQELHLSNANPGTEHLKAACSDLEKIRKLKKEAEFLEASFRAKAASLEQGDADEHSLSSASEQEQIKKTGKVSNTSEKVQNPVEKVVRKPRGFWSLLVRNSTQKNEPGRSMKDQNVAIAAVDNQDLELNEIRRFELLRNELIELEKRVQRSTNDSQNEEEADHIDDKDKLAPVAANKLLVKAPKKDNVIAKSMEKIKETTTDVWQGTQLLAVDVAAAMVLLKRALTGDELAEKEKKALQRTLTDLASVVPIGFLMLLPVTAVGHAAMLAFIQRYVPALIPSTYAPERLDLLRQLEKVKEMEGTEMNSDEMTEGVSETSSNTE
ncbi:uncharacterized protein [Elaeis guineensis]|uniref:Uncharacterized protein LOC105060550 isoform X1 n=1 Tax=Elaeis guineensis var. tenera TaxID=51953 RepID=A0A6I9SGE5_ELAGV|nr:uncharacterized protein LOC105060550 isoform X1 [Elaeis guineensis]XP_010942620.1 uncharacterized protein LOC105060550 isoform X1 [Elaeis guineensis]